MSGDAVNATPGSAVGLRDSAAVALAEKTDRMGLIDNVVVFALGLSLQFNIVTATFGLPFARLSDLVPFAVIPYFCLRTDFLARALDCAARIGLVLILLIVSLILKNDRGPGDIYMNLILIVYFVQTLQIVMVFGDRLLTMLCAGLLTGYFGSVVVLIAAGARLELAAYGLAVPQDATITPETVEFLQDKLGGLWTAGNQTGHIFAAAGAAALCLSMQFKSKLIYLLYLAGLLISFPLTNNRAGLIVPFVVLIIVIGRGTKAWHLALPAAAIGFASLYSAITGTLPLSGSLTNALEGRLYGDSNLGNNLSERLDSGFEAIGLMLRNPFGIGNVSLENELRALTGVDTPHNGIISLGLQSGVLVALLYVVSLVQIFIGRSRDYGSFIYLTVVFSTLSMFFEQLTATQYFLFLIALVLAAWVARGVHTRAAALALGYAAEGGAAVPLREAQYLARASDQP